MKRKAKVLLIVALLLFGIPAFLIFFLRSDAVALDRFDRVAVGMTEAQVQQLLGAPLSIRHDTKDTTAFFYGGALRFRWCTMEVFFGSDGRATGKFHDH
jgi:outer membrane protein assembly factor BamE (lipoprotein component of BamABCDE complex)